MILNLKKNGKKLEITVYIFIDDVYTVNIIYQKRSEDASADLKNKYFDSLSIEK